MDMLSIQNATLKALEYAPQVIGGGSDFSVEGFETPGSRDGGTWSVIIGYTPQGFASITGLAGTGYARNFKDLVLDAHLNLVKMQPYLADV
jgi:hypothetical protein